MYTDQDIESAVRAGVLDNNNAIAFREYVEQLKGAPMVDDEHFRLITGFNDIFVSIACLLFLASLAWVGTTTSPQIGAILCTIAAWGLAEYFTRKRRMALPSIVLLLGFVGAVVATAGFLLAELLENLFLQIKPLGQSADAWILIFCVGTGIAALAALFHWRRFKVPITVAAARTASARGRRRHREPPGSSHPRARSSETRRGTGSRRRAVRNRPPHHRGSEPHGGG